MLVMMSADNTAHAIMMTVNVSTDMVNESKVQQNLQTAGSKVNRL